MTKHRPGIKSTYRKALLYLTYLRRLGRERTLTVVETLLLRSFVLVPAVSRLPLRLYLTIIYVGSIYIITLVLHLATIAFTLW